MNVAEKEAAALWVKLQKIPRIAGAKIFKIKKSYGQKYSVFRPFTLN